MRTSARTSGQSGCGPRKTSKLNTSVDIIFVNCIAASDIFVFRVEVFVIVVVVKVEIIKHDISATHISLLLLLLGSLSFSVVFKQSCTFTLLAAGIRINFKLDATCNYTVAIEPLNNIVL